MAATTEILGGPIILFLRGLYEVVYLSTMKILPELHPPGCLEPTSSKHLGVCGKEYLPCNDTAGERGNVRSGRGKKICVSYTVHK
jgi:hypothetical protein